MVQELGVSGGRGGATGGAVVGGGGIGGAIQLTILLGWFRSWVCLVGVVVQLAVLLLEAAVLAAPFS